MHVLTRLLREQPLGALGALVLLTMAFLAICAPFFAPFDPTQGDATALNSPPDAKYWLGTDAFGRDNLSRLIFGSRISLLVGVGASLLGVVTGAALGIVATYRGGWLDVITQRLMDAMLAFPMLLLALTMAAVGALPLLFGTGRLLDAIGRRRGAVVSGGRGVRRLDGVRRLHHRCVLERGRVYRSGHQRLGRGPRQLRGEPREVSPRHPVPVGPSPCPGPEIRPLGGPAERGHPTGDVRRDS